MFFLYPNFLWLLSLLSIPIVIHFFNIRKYKKIYFSDTQLLKQIIQESQIKSRIKEYFILFSRVLALLFLVLAFAQPTLKKTNSALIHKNSEIVIYIDNSFSMENINQHGKLFELAIGKAKDIIQSFSKSTKFIILTNDANILNQKKLSQNEAIEELSKIKISSVTTSLSVLLNRIKTFHLSSPVLFLISDAQKNFTDIQKLSDFSFPVYYLLLYSNEKNNISIDSVWMDNPVVLPNNHQQLNITLSNHTNENINDIPVKLVLNNVQTSIINISISAHQSIKTSISFVPKISPFQFGKIFINDYPISFDDEMYFSINTNTHLKALLINGYQNPLSSKYIRAFFQNDSVFTFAEQQEKQINFSEISQQDIIILNEITEYSSGLEEQLKIISQQGKAIIIIPMIQNGQYALPSELNQFQWKTDTIPQTVNDNILKHPFFSLAFEKINENYNMPKVKESISTTSNIPYEPLIEMNNNKPLLFRYQSNNIKYFVFSSTLHPDKNQMVLHSLFVPIMYQLCFTSIPNIPVYYYSDISENIRIPNIKFTSDYSPKIISVNQEDKNFQLIPLFNSNTFASYIHLPSQYQIKPGHYYLQWKNNNIFSLSFNYNRKESEMLFYTEQELKNMVQQQGLKNFNINDVSNIPAKKIIQTEISGTTYWKLCLILALLFFLLESIIIRWIK